MRVYYVSDPLSAGEQAEVEGMMGWTVEQIRIPYLLPVPDVVDGVQRITGVESALTGALKTAGILRDYGKRCAFVAFMPNHWSVEFGETIARLTGSWPYLIQTAQVLSQIGVGGELRILDLDGALRS